MQRLLTVLYPDSQRPPNEGPPIAEAETHHAPLDGLRTRQADAP